MAPAAASADTVVPMVMALSWKAEKKVSKTFIYIHQKSSYVDMLLYALTLTRHPPLLCRHLFRQSRGSPPLQDMT